MYILNVISHFSSAHKLEGYEGDCRKLHGHNWKVRMAVICKDTDKIGLSIDFGELKQQLDELLSKFDHTFLNDLEWFNECNPTSENIARILFLELSKKVNKESCRVSEIEVWESERSSVIYYE